MNIILTTISPFFIRLVSLFFSILPAAAFDYLWEITLPAYLWEAFANYYFLDDFAESPSPIVTGSELGPASNATTTEVAEPELCPCIVEEYQNRIFLNQLELEVQKASDKQNQKNRRNATEPNSDSDEKSNDEPSTQQENNEAEAESPSISESSEVKPSTDETHTESNGIIEAPLIPDTFEDPHDCCATCSPISEATADQGTNNGRNTKETSDFKNL
ncbi:hypothetical protein DAPPUDRAFT_256992 [Daphnia pulex]|uniref:Uncharacterized protein n=1 Tax=Daphnia pulex TaxID=6669 RepID=E9HCM8_DAPPU|nr:hypothetical protein DAPPUDRAFT_256992 [Daphnia pulex]|eukprot:EFX70555.1 hypothetical protein DAPPUDRAFT_256992 [Daphnia pulex]